jgi:hypothetical protein
MYTTDMNLRLCFDSLVVTAPQSPRGYRLAIQLPLYDGYRLPAAQFRRRALADNLEGGFL